MERRARLNPISPKRAAALAEQGIRPWSTLTNTGSLPRTAAVQNSKPKPRPRDTGPDKGTAATVVARDFGRCARCGSPVSGERGRDWSLHHRRPRAMGGTVRPDSNEPQNLILLHGSGASSCHGHVERHRAEAYANGWLVRQAQDPAEVPVLHAVHGRVWLTDAGTTSTFSPNHNDDFTPATEEVKA